MDSQTRQLEQLLAHRASAWLETLRNPTQAERAAFVAWLKESPRNVQDFLLMLSLDRALYDVDPNREFNLDALLGELEPRVAVLPRRLTPAAPATHWWRRRRWPALAAGLMSVLIVGWIWHHLRSDSGREFETSIGEQRAFELDDGSVIQLNTNSRVAIIFSGTSRDVRLLRGEALFRVHHEAARPFRVHTSDALIQAVGTEFNVYDRPDGTVVAVIQGHVAVDAAPAKSDAVPDAAGPIASVTANVTSRSKSIRILGTSEEAMISHRGTMSVREVPNVQEVVAWRERRLIFREQSLEHIISEFNRYSRKRIELQGPAASSRVYSGVFDADDVDSFAQVLARDPSLVVETSEQRITVRAL
jgi:transmembrane sensor